MIIELLMVEIGSPASLIITAIASLATAFGVQKWLPDLIKSNSRDSDCVRNIIRLTSAIKILLTVLKDKVGDDPGMKAAVSEVEEIVKDIKRDYEAKRG